jgi:hypothetical protein
MRSMVHISVTALLFLSIMVALFIILPASERGLNASAGKRIANSVSAITEALPADTHVFVVKGEQVKLELSQKLLSSFRGVESTDLEGDRITVTASHGAFCTWTALHVLERHGISVVLEKKDAADTNIADEQKECPYSGAKPSPSCPYGGSGAVAPDVRKI